MVSVVYSSVDNSAVTIGVPTTCMSCVFVVVGIAAIIVIAIISCFLLKKYRPGIDSHVYQ